MTLHLLACPSCSRHVRSRETACPFCGVALSESFRATLPPTPPVVRLARAALVALGAGAAAGTGCGAASELGGGSAVDASALASDASDDAPDASEVAPDADDNCCVPYGLVPPPPDDAGPADDAATPADSDVGVTVPYGIAPGGGTLGG